MLNIDDDGGASRQTAHEFVRERLRRGILRGSIPTGSRLVQAEIATQLRVSTTPVREALRDLSTEGLIRLDPHRGAVVRELDTAELQEIYDLRALLEPEAVRRVARTIDRDSIEKGERLLELMEREEDTGIWADLNREFHELLASLVHPPRLASILTNLQDSAAPYVGLAISLDKDKVATANAEHRELLQQLGLGDAERAARIMHEHLRSTLRTLEESASDQLRESSKAEAGAKR